MTRAELLAKMKEIAHEELETTGDKTAFTGDWIPDRWFRERKNLGFMTRCENEHVSSICLSSEEEGLLCLDCFCSVVWTFPEDNTGPLEESLAAYIKSRGKKNAI